MVSAVVVEMSMTSIFLLILSKIKSIFAACKHI
jgi:hypothetical protein